MEEKEAKRRYNSVWPLSFAWRNCLSIFGRSSGFTLVELLTVVGVIGVLLVAALIILNPVTQAQKANDAKRKSDLSQIQKSLETYFHDSNKYPAVSVSPAYRIVRLDGSTANWGTQFLPYMNLLPKDPKPNFNYVYYTTPNRQTYYLYASLERPGDKQLCNGGIDDACSSIEINLINPDACGGICNFGVSSPNTNP